MTKEDSEKFVAKTLELTPENVIRNMRITKLLHVTKNGKFYSDMATKYVTKMGKYSKYCKEEEQDNWAKSIEAVILCAGEVNDYTLTEELHGYQNAGEIMECMISSKDWEKVKETVNNQGHTGSTMSSLGQILLRFSPNGVEFVQEIIGDSGLELLSCLNKAYQEQKRKAPQLVLSSKTSGQSV